MKHVIIAITLGLFSLSGYTIDKTRYYSHGGKKTGQSLKSYKRKYGVSRNRRGKVRRAIKGYRGQRSGADWGGFVTRKKYGKIRRGRRGKAIGYGVVEGKPKPLKIRRGRRGIVAPQF